MFRRGAVARADLIQQPSYAVGRFGRGALVGDVSPVVASDPCGPRRHVRDGLDATDVFAIPDVAPQRHSPYRLGATWRARAHLRIRICSECS